MSIFKRLFSLGVRQVCLKRYYPFSHNIPDLVRRAEIGLLSQSDCFTLTHGLFNFNIPRHLHATSLLTSVFFSLSVMGTLLMKIRPWYTHTKTRNVKEEVR
jgi:hypothetical protein